MAHIINCIADVELGGVSKQASGHIEPYARSFTPLDRHNSRKMQPQPATVQQKRYQLFPRDKQLPVLNSTKTSDLDKSSLPSGSQRDEKPDKFNATTLKNKINQHSLVRRRKISVPELGPMTTVHEVPMDSPTIPGRPPIHERSISAPAEDGRHQQRKHQQQSSHQHYQLYHRQQEQQMQEGEGGKHERKQSQRREEHYSIDSFLLVDPDDEYDGGNPSEPYLTKPKCPPSPTQLARLVIPHNDTKKPQQILPQRATSLNRGCSVPPEISRSNTVGGSLLARTPCTPSASSTELSTPCSASTNGMSAATLPTPTSAPSLESNRASPRPWDAQSATPVTLERSMTPQPVGAQSSAPSLGHRRAGSESSSLIDRGRPRKRSDFGTYQGHQSARAERRAETSSEREAFRELPGGFPLVEAMQNFPAEELEGLHKQAYQQAERFEVLKAVDVEALSKELRRLDERTEYLRRTYTSLRAGRRNLHSRICQFLRSPRVAKFSYESMLRQEEALIELDTSIDDWVNKLEIAENRRTRVRQKLLEHVAGAAILVMSPNSAPTSEPPRDTRATHGPAGVADVSTPPRSPTKQGSALLRPAAGSPSPQRVVAQVPSTILENPVVEEAESQTESSSNSGPALLKRSEVESIRVYAGDDIATLLADVENEFSKISHDITEPIVVPDGHENGDGDLDQPDRESKMGWSDNLPPNCITKPLKSTTCVSPSAPPPPAKDDPSGPSNDVEVLSSAVFKPQNP